AQEFVGYNNMTGNLMRRPGNFAQARLGLGFFLALADPLHSHTGVHALVAGLVKGYHGYLSIRLGACRNYGSAWTNNGTLRIYHENLSAILSRHQIAAAFWHGYTHVATLQTGISRVKSHCIQEFSKVIPLRFAAIFDINALA